MTHPNGLTGLMNTGNTCYLNSVIQCLMSSKGFVYYLLKQKYLPGLEHNIKKGEELNSEQLYTKCCETLTFRLNELFEAMWEQNRIVSPHGLKMKMGTIDSIFAFFDQNDAHETLIFLLSQLHEETKMPGTFDSENIMPITNIKHQIFAICNNPNIDSTKKVELCDDYRKLKHTESYLKYRYEKFQKKNELELDSITRRFFSGIYYSKVTCLNCDYSSICFEYFDVLSLSITETDKSLTDCLNREFNSEEILHGSEQYKCKLCKTLVDAKKQLRIYKTPEILIFHLKRFVSQNEFFIKNKHTITFPIDLLVFLGNNYELYGIVEHNGELNGGHYNSICKNFINNKWYKFDDEQIAYLDSIDNSICSYKSYMLFYQKI